MITADCPFPTSSLHTTPLGIERIRRNLDLGPEVDVIRYCQSLIVQRHPSFERKGKNWYVTAGDTILTVNAASLTIITAHRIKI